MSLVVPVRIASSSSIFANNQPLQFIAGPCVIESEEHAIFMAQALRKVLHSFVYKASFDKANRSSVSSFRGPGLTEGVRILGEVRKLSIPVLTDIHTPDQAALVAPSVDVLQIPAFLCRQTDLLVEAGKTGRVVNIKKGQFVSPHDFLLAAEKVASTGNTNIILTERGASFGYNNLVVDMRSLPILATSGYPVVFDATHSVQLPGAAGSASSGQPQFIEPLARAATAIGVAGIFVEVHDRPENALSDGANALRLQQLLGVTDRLRAIDKLVKGFATEDDICEEIRPALQKV